MRKKISVLGLVVACVAAVALFLANRGGIRGPVVVAAGAAAEAGGPQIVLYTGENFTGRAITVTGTVFDLPKDQEPDGSLYDWNDQVRSIVVVSGTWRLYQNGRCNTRLDDTPIEAFAVGEKLPAQGWSALVSAASAGQLQIADLSAAGIGQDISSVELISTSNLPDWALGFRKP